ncbi:MAG TPA: isochorismate synthase [bacterium]|nr:isochorismate synthase [bacterium]
MPVMPVRPRAVTERQDAAALSGAAPRLRRAVEEAARRAQVLRRPVLAWTTVRISPRDLVDLFERTEVVAGERILWDRPEDRFSLIGIGSAWECTASGPERFKETDAAWQWMQARAVGDTEGPTSWGAGLGAFYGFAFSPEGPASAEWSGYPAAWVVAPRLCIAQLGDRAWITLVLMVDPDSGRAADEEADACVGACRSVLGPGAHDRQGVAGTPVLRIVAEIPSGDAWRRAVGATAQAVGHGALSKAVLARALHCCSDHFDAAGALRRLRTEYAGCTVFAIARGNRCFLGATPERLVRVRDGTVTTGAVAGSAPRGGTAEEDRRFGEFLLASAKDRVEHTTVVEAIRSGLADLCATISVGAVPQLLVMRNVQHLCTPVVARLRDRRSILELAERLHPTPAVGGVPREKALRWICEHEGWDRGWYSGLVGWMDRAGEGEAAVAIRSALLQDTTALLFAGCGIVAGSDPDREYAESALKLRPMLSALGRT